MAAEKVYRSVIGRVQFAPEDREAAGKQIRSVTIRQAGFREQAVKVSVTLWPSHAHIPVEQGDILFVEGTYSQGKGNNQAGEEVKYHNLSANVVLNLGKGDSGTKVETVNTEGDDEPADDDIPF